MDLLRGDREYEARITDLADGNLSGPEWDEWLAAHPEAAEQVEIARRVRALLIRLQTAQIVLPEGFEARLLERVRADSTLLDLLDVWFLGFGGALMEMLDLVFGLLGEWRMQSAPAAEGA
jgi:hypothetical protein